MTRPTTAATAPIRAAAAGISAFNTGNAARHTFGTSASIGSWRRIFRCPCAATAAAASRAIGEERRGSSGLPLSFASCSTRTDNNRIFVARRQFHTFGENNLPTSAACTVCAATGSAATDNEYPSRSRHIVWRLEGECSRLVKDGDSFAVPEIDNSIRGKCADGREDC